LLPEYSHKLTAGSKLPTGEYFSCFAGLWGFNHSPLSGGSGMSQPSGGASSCNR
jgi:hypothetical protein